MMRKILHVGCGAKGTVLPYEFAAYKETRLDANAACQPDIVASAVAMPMIESESFDCVFASHMIEHLYAHEVAMALAEFRRVLKPGGQVVLFTPDLQGIGGYLAMDQAHLPLMQTGWGPVAPLDMIYGHRPNTGLDTHQAHRTGFTKTVLKNALLQAGFTAVEVKQSNRFELEGRAFKPEAAEVPAAAEELAEVA